MKKATIALFVVLMFVFSCTKESVSPDLDSGSDVLKKAGVEKVVTKTLKIHESSGTMGVVTCDAWELYPDCNDCPTGYVFLIQGMGHATHMGAFTVQNYACFNPGTGALTEPLRGILTAANGDQIFTQVAYITPDPDLGLVYHYEILKGNGRFKGATGFIDMWGIIDYGTMTFDLEGLGEITY